MKAIGHISRRNFVVGSAALAVAGRSVAQTFGTTGDVRMDEIQAEINEVEPKDYKTYCRPMDGLDIPFACEEPKFAALKRLDAVFLKVMQEVKSVPVTEGAPPAIWYVYNMGLVVKSAQTLFSIDLHHRLAEKLAPDLDFALITHNHFDHYTQRFYETMNNVLHKTVVSNFADNYGAQHFGRKAGGLGGFTRGGKTFKFKDVMVKTSISDHNSYLIDYTMPFEIEIGDFRFYHSGDSQNIAKLNPAEAPDLWFVHPFCGLNVPDGVNKFHPKKTVLLHLNELQHGKNRWRYTWYDGMKVKMSVEEAGGMTMMPVWGDRIA